MEFLKSNAFNNYHKYAVNLLLNMEYIRIELTLAGVEKNIFSLGRKKYFESGSIKKHLRHGPKKMYVLNILVLV